MPIFYIDPQFGNDIDNNGLSPEAPKQTFGSIRFSIGAGGKALFKSGSVVTESIVLGGEKQEVSVYGGKEPFIVDCENVRDVGIDVNGQVGSWVHNFVVRNMTALAGFAVKPASRTIIEDFSIVDCDGFGVMMNGGSRCVIRNFSIHRCGKYGVRLNNTTSVKIHDFLITGYCRQQGEFCTAIEISTGGGGNLVERGTIFEMSGDGIMLRRTSGVVVRTCLVGPYVDDGICIEGSHQCTVVNNLVRGPLATVLKPALKIGDDFGHPSATPSDNNIVKNNVLIGTIANTPAVAGGTETVSIGANNDIDFNVYIVPNSNWVWANWNDGTNVLNGVTLATFQSWGYETNGKMFSSLDDAGLTNDGLLKTTSVVRGDGEFVGHFLDHDSYKFRHPISPGPLEPEPFVRIVGRSV